MRQIFHAEDADVMTVDLRDASGIPEPEGSSKLTQEKVTPATRMTEPDEVLLL